MTNRWFTLTGRGKRIPKNLEPFRADGYALFHPESRIKFNRILQTKYIKEKYDLSLSDAVNLLVYLTGLYGNAEESRLFNAERYPLGKQIAQAILSKYYQ